MEIGYVQNENGNSYSKAEGEVNWYLKLDP